MKITLQEMAIRIKKKPRTLHQWRCKYKNTDHPKAIFFNEAIQETPHSPIYYDERVADKYWDSLQNCADLHN